MVEWVMLSRALQLMKDIALAHLPFGLLTLVDFVSRKSGSRQIGVIAGVVYYALFVAILLIILYLVQPFIKGLAKDYNDL